MTATHAAVVVVADDPAYPVGSTEWNADHVGIVDTSSEPTVDQVVRPLYSASITGLPLIIDSGRLVDVQAGGVLVIAP
jgi:hypothetical protein